MMMTPMGPVGGGRNHGYPMGGGSAFLGEPDSSTHSSPLVEDCDAWTGGAGGPTSVLGRPVYDTAGEPADHDSREF